MLITTAPATVLLACLWQPLVLPCGQRVYMVEFGLPEPLTFAPDWVEGGLHRYVATSRYQVPLLSGSGQPMMLCSEVGPGSSVRLALNRSGPNALVIRAVALLDHRVFNPFAQTAEKTR